MNPYLKIGLIIVLLTLFFSLYRQFVLWCRAEGFRENNTYHMIYPTALALQNAARDAMNQLQPLYNDYVTSQESGKLYIRENEYPPLRNQIQSILEPYNYPDVIRKLKENIELAQKEDLLKIAIQKEMEPPTQEESSEVTLYKMMTTLNPSAPPIQNRT